MDDVSRIIGPDECWEYGRVCKEGKVALLLGKGVEGVSDSDGGGMCYVLDR